MLFIVSLTDKLFGLNVTFEIDAALFTPTGGKLSLKNFEFSAQNGFEIIFFNFTNAGYTNFSNGSFYLVGNVNY